MFRATTFSKSTVQVRVNIAISACIEVCKLNVDASTSITCLVKRLIVNQIPLEENLEVDDVPSLVGNSL